MLNELAWGLLYCSYRSPLGAQRTALLVAEPSARPQLHLAPPWPLRSSNAH